MTALPLMATLALAEARLRLRRLSTVLVLLVVIAISWRMIPDPRAASHLSFLTVHHAQVAYTSAALAMGSAKMAAILFGLAGFYLVRGRAAEDLRSGIGSVIGATPTGNGLLLASRWLGGVAYLATLGLALMLTVLLCHLLRGSGPLQLTVYLQTYLTMLLPVLCFSTSCALLCDSHAHLMGKTGDILFFFLWAAQFPIADSYFQTNPTVLSAWMLIDFTGLSASSLTLAGALQIPVSAISKGFTTFDSALAPVVLPAYLWSWQVSAMRIGAALLSMLPLLLAALLFHRYSPDRVRTSSARLRRTPLAILNGWLQPLARVARPLFALSARLPGVAGQVCADIALTLMAAPSAIALAIAFNVAALATGGPVLALVLTLACACWGILVSDLSVRDHKAANEDLTGAVPGGPERRYLRQLLAAIALGLLFMGIGAVRLGLEEPLRALALLAGIASCSALATLFGRTARTGRLFMALFLFWLYVASSISDVALLDAFGINGAANGGSVLLQVLLASVATAAGVVYNRYQAR
jgi:hypothetical protein